MTMVEQEVACPKCGGRMWDNRATKKNPKQPDYKCRDRGCEGVIWPPRGAAAPAPAPRASAPARAPLALGASLPYEEDEAPAPAQNGNAVDLTPSAYLYGRCLAKARTIAIEQKLDSLTGDIAGAVTSIAATLFIQANKR